MRYAKFIVAASLFIVAAPAGHAETAAGLSTGVSGSRAGLISEGGKATSTIDAKISASAPSPKEANSVDVRAFARDRDDGDQRRATKKKKKTSSPNAGFNSFAGTARTRY